MGCNKNYVRIPHQKIVEELEEHQILGQQRLVKGISEY